MKPKTSRRLLLIPSFLALGLILTIYPCRAQGGSETGATPAAKRSSQEQLPRAQNGKRLLTALDALKVHGVGSVTLSPDNRLIAYTSSELNEEDGKPWTRTTQIWVVPAAGGQAIQYTRGEESSTHPRWSPDGRILAFLSSRGAEKESQVWFMHAEAGEAWQVTRHKGGVSGFEFSPDGSRLVLAATQQPSKEEQQKKKKKDDAFVVDHNLKMRHLWLWDIKTKEEKRLTSGDFTCSDPHWSPDGRLISFTVRPTPKADDGGLSDIWVLDVQSGERKKLVSNPGPDASARWSPDGSQIAYVGSPDASGGVAQSFLYLVPSNGGPSRQLSAAFPLNANTPEWSKDGKRLFFSAVDHQNVALFSCDAAAGTVQKLDQTEGVFSLADDGVAGSLLVGSASTVERPADVFSFDPLRHEIKILTHQNAWLDAFALAPAEVISWKSQDGTEIEGVLTHTVDFDPARKYPLLLNPHGGPTGASLNRFNATVQVLAANGYLVLQPNFRGSTGRGLKFSQANKNSWGKGDYQDCMTGVDAILAKGWADPERLGAFGWSYGGYMTFWILTQTHRFKAVSPGAGLTNIYSMYSQNDIQRYLRWFFADASPWDDRELYWDRSPMKYVENVTTPTLILHGQQDTRVPIAQAKEFYRALVERHVPVEFVVYPRENHGFREPLHQMDRMRRYVAFFAKYLNQTSKTEPEALMKDMVSAF